MKAVFVIEEDEDGTFVASFMFDEKRLFSSAPCPSWGTAMDAVETLREHAAYAAIQD